ncbi:hypothetical protein CCMSSC00406_0001183 [Pleurotus cornucopiae]|uniref:Uncharacterized protein n=1 Tax=Pleurotus cornucopiae TaxID=5321 RepID=A0ACB7IMB4_PLECO|nr:hypothetical protein CCMSSC00406_0001183 [Pleurotus cornucopiae]
MDETSDILGGKINSPPPPKTGLWNTMSFTAKSTLTLVLVLIAYVAFANVWRQVMRWREKSYRLSLRRKHGIPDNDHRPFNVAYAAVLRAKREDSNKNVAPAGRTPAITQGGQAVSDQRQGAQQTYANVYTPLDTTASAAGSIRQRQGAPLRHAESSWSTPGLPGRYVSEGISSALGNGSRLRTVSSNSNTLSNARGASVGQADFERSPSKRRFDPDGPNGLAFVDERGEGEAADGQGTTTRGSKRGLDDAEGYDDAYYYYDDGDEAAGPSKRKRDKRARKVSMEKNPNGQLVVVSGNVSEDMEVDDEEGEGDDIVTDLRDVVRGKKRDRAEAGSTFGGDDDDDESQPEEDVANLSTKERRHRKRRTVSKRRSDAGIPIRGRKRDRGESESEHSEVESSEESDGIMDHGQGKRKHKKRGKRGSHVHEAGTPRYNGYEHGSGSGSDVSMDGSRVSSQPGCKGRKIGEEWESSGVRYKVGPSGERLRMVLMKQARNKFVMPADSQHPDRDANMEIWVGEWLTDEEYKAAKLQQLTDSLSTSTTSSTEPETPQPEETTVSSRASVPAPPVTGKNLLWEAPMTPSQRRYSSHYRDFNNNSLPKDPFRQSVATNIGLRVNPFQQQAPVSSSRRLSSPNPRSLLTSTALQSSTPGSPLSASSMTSLADSTNILGSGAGLSMSMLGHRGSPRRGFSKWEKQDREAEAMRKVREAKRAKEKEREDKEKREKEACAPVAAPLTLPTPAPAPAPTATATPALPTFAFSKPAEEKDKPISGAAPAPTAAAAGKPASLLGFGPPPAVSNSNDAPKAAAAPAAAPAALPSFGGPAAPKPQEKPSNPFSGPSSSSSSTPSFSFGKPAEPTSTAPPTSFNPPAQPATSFPTFSNPAPAASSAPTDATSNKPAGTSGPLKFAFGPTSGGASSTPATTTPAPGGFAWGAPPAQPSGAQPSSAPDASSQPKPTAPSSEPLKFSFPKSGQSNNIFGQNGSNPSMPMNSNPTAPKTNTFSFGPNAATSTAAPTTSNDASKPAAPSPAAFGFGAPKAASATPAATPSETPKFSFGFGNKSEPAKSDAKPTSTFGGFGTANPSTTSAPNATAASSPFGSNVFGGSSAPAASSNNNIFGAASAPSSGSQPAEAPKSAFSGFGNNSSKPSAFGSTTPASSPFGTFGGVNGANVFGSSNGGQPKQASSFGAPSSTPAAPSSTFGFGQTTSTPSSTPADAPKAAPTFSFGTPSTAAPASTPAASGSGGFSFNFGGNKTAASPSPFGSAPSAAPPSVFGNTDKPAGVFGFGAPSTTPSGTPASGGFSFGVPSTPSK